MQVNILSRGFCYIISGEKSQEGVWSVEELKMGGETRRKHTGRLQNALVVAP